MIGDPGLFERLRAETGEHPMTTPTTIIATAEPTTIELFLAINELGEHMTSYEGATEAVDELRANYGFEAVRVFKISVTVNVAVTVPTETKAPAQVAVS